MKEPPVQPGVHTTWTARGMGHNDDCRDRRSCVQRRLDKPTCTPRSLLHQETPFHRSAARHNLACRVCTREHPARRFCKVVCTGYLTVLLVPITIGQGIHPGCGDLSMCRFLPFPQRGGGLGRLPCRFGTSARHKRRRSGGAVPEISHLGQGRSPIIIRHRLSKQNAHALHEAR